MGLPNWGHLVYADGVVVLGANAAYDAATGNKLWQKTVRPGKLPIVHGQWLITGSGAYDLRTGEQRMTRDTLTGQETPWRHTRAYGCGPVLGCQHLLFFRSGADGFFDLRTNGTTNFGGVRPGCSRTILAANGLLIHPQGYSGCACCYNYKTCLALISAPERRDTWYVFPRHAIGGPIKRIAINFGAPGDRRDNHGNAWLSFPRPMLTSACPAPVTILLDNAASYHRRRATTSIRGTDSPWLYGSGLRGQGRIVVDLALQPNVVLPVRAARPVIDGKLDDSCWPDVRAVPFENTPFSMVAAGIDFRIFRNDKNIYFGYRRKPIAYARSDADQAELSDRDSLDIYLTDRGKRVGIRFTIRRNGNAVAKLGTLGRSRQIDPTWKGEWKCAVQENVGGWAAEMALPIETLTEAGMSLKRLQLNCMSQNLTQSGLEAVFLVDPLYANNFRRYSRFRNVVGPRSDSPQERAFTVRLHFAEIDNVKAGQRVFDVALQGQTVLKDLDIVKEAGGRNVALVKELTGVKASHQVVIELTTPDRGSGAEPGPMVSAVEIREE